MAACHIAQCSSGRVGLVVAFRGKNRCTSLEELGGRDVVIPVAGPDVK